MTISRIEFTNELIKQGVSEAQAIQLAQELDTNDGLQSGQGLGEDSFTGSQANVDDPNTAFLRAGATPTNDQLVDQALAQIPEYDVSGRLNDFFNSLGGGSEQEQTADQIWEEQKWWDRVDAKIKQKTRELQGDLKGIAESATLAKSAQNVA